MTQIPITTLTAGFEVRTTEDWQLSNWRSAVAANQTRLGLCEWVRVQRQNDEKTLEEMADLFTRELVPETGVASVGEFILYHHDLARQNPRIVALAKALLEALEDARSSDITESLGSIPGGAPDVR